MWFRRAPGDPLRRRGVKGWRWKISQDAAQWLPAKLLDDPEAFLLRNPLQRPLKESLVRMACIIPGPKGDLFLKHYKMRNLLEGWKYFVYPSKARQEWQIAQQALTQGIPTPVPLAMAERRGGGFLQDAFLVTQAIVPSSPLIELIPKGGHEDLFIRAARLIRLTHEAGLFHQDLHAGNILMGGKDKELYLIDLHRATLARSVSKQRRLWNLAQFFYSLKGLLSPEDKKAFLQRYDDEGNVFKGNLDQGLKEIDRQEQRLYRRHMKSRTKRCLKESGGFQIARESGWRIWCRRGWKTQGLLKIVTRHKDIVTKGKDGLLKDDRRTAISLFNYKKTRLCVKEYRYQGAWRRWKERFRNSKARRGWLMGNGLVVRGIEGIIPQALLEHRRKGFLQEAFLIMETPPGYIELDRYVVKAFGGQRHDDTRKATFLKAVAEFMAALYLRNIIHRDLKTCNIMVQEGAETWSFALVDMDDIRLDRNIRTKGFLKELIQLHTSTPLFIGMDDRIRFLTRYLRLIGRDDRGDIIQKVVKGSRGRHLVYVAPQGDVVMDVDWEGLCDSRAHFPLTKEAV